MKAHLQDTSTVPSGRCCLFIISFPEWVELGTRSPALRRGGSAGIRNLYSYVTSSGDIRYDNRSCAAIVQRKSRVRGQISAPSVPSCVCANELSFKTCVFQVVKSPLSRRGHCYCYRRHVRTLKKPGPA